MRGELLFSGGQTGGFAPHEIYLLQEELSQVFTKT